MVNVPHHSEHLHGVTLATEAFSFLFLYDTSLGFLLPFYLLSQLEAIIPYQNNSYFFLIMTIKIKYYDIKLCAKNQLSVKTIHVCPQPCQRALWDRVTSIGRAGRVEGAPVPTLCYCCRSKAEVGKWESKSSHTVGQLNPFSYCSEHYRSHNNPKDLARKGVSSLNHS